MNAIIIGGGIAGLTTAIALRKVGIEADVFERAPFAREVGAGISLWANALDALAVLGLAGELHAHGFKEVHPELRTPDGRVLQRSAPSSRDSTATSVGAMHRADLLAVLASRVDPQRIHWGQECTGVADDGQKVTAEFRDGTSMSADLLIGADGIHSLVRARCFSSTPPIYSGYTAWRAVVTSPDSNLIACEIWGRGRRFGTIPLSEDRVYWYATHNTPETKAAPGPASKPILSELFRGWFNSTGALIDAADEAAILRNDIYDRDPLDRWCSGRIALSGDAAHPMTPNLGQGACQGIEDAVVLAASLKTSKDVAAGLVQYQRRRATRANHIVRLSRRIGQIAQWESPMLCSLRDNLVGLLPSSMSERQMTEITHYHPLTDAERALFPTI